MTVRTDYHYSDMSEIADYFEQQAKLKRDNAARFGRQSPRRAEYIGAAAAWESAAYLIRHSKKREPKS